MQELHLRAVRQQRGQFVGLAGDRIERGELADVLLQRARQRIGRKRIAVDVKRRRVAEHNIEPGHIAALGGEQAVDGRIDLADLRIAAGHRDAVTIRRTRRPADEDVVLHGHHNEQRVVPGYPIGGKPDGESVKCRIVSRQAADIVLLTGSEGALACGGRALTVEIADGDVDDRYSCLQHRRGVAE